MACRLPVLTSGSGAGSFLARSLVLNDGIEKAIDLALDRASGIREETTRSETAYEEWRRTRAS